MENKMKKITLNVEDIFQDIPDDPENVLLTIPPEILSELGWKEGDTIKVILEDNSIILERKNG